MKTPVPCSLVAALLASCSHESAPVANPSVATSVSSGIAIEDVTAASGIGFVQTTGRTPSTQLLEVKGSGLALVDYDNDGDLDVFVPNGAYLDAPSRGPGCRMFENVGAMKFRDVTSALGVAFTGFGMGVAVGDVDADGFDDIYIAAFGNDVLLRNDGGKRFVDITSASGLGDPRWGTSAAFGDVDSDGDLDLYVVNYVKFDPAKPYPPERFQGVDVFAGPVGKPCDSDALYLNDGGGHFTDASTTSGITKVLPSAGLGVVIGDFDGDARQDILVGNDSMPSFFFKNSGGAQFVEIAESIGLARNGDGAAQATMGIAIGDVNGDGKPDVFTTNFANDTNTLRVAAKEGFFYSDRTSQYGVGQVSRPFLGWATAFADFDLDGDEDLVVFNGHVYPNASRQTMDSTYAQAPLLFARVGGRFERVTADANNRWLAEEHVDRSVAFGDLDLDGDLDMVVGGVNQKMRVLANRARGHWLSVELIDERPGIGNRRGIGAKITLSQGGALQTRWIVGGGSYMATSTAIAHFGLAATTGLALEVTWPDGVKQHVADVAIDKRAVVRRK
ncbi:MAG: CRTAC1 family protein [Planctomycetota bacterium]|nr:CRTAC1 family protein [Planctomycetota bacterium]